VSEQAVAVPDPTGVTEERLITEVAYGFDPNMNFKKLALEADYFAKGFRLVEDKDDLAGVPHVITAVTYRPGYSGSDGTVSDYISLEAVVADEDVLNSNPVKHGLPAELHLYPNEPVVYNDGGTGIRRYMTELFHSIGLIDVGQAPEDGNAFDKPYQSWASGADRATSGITADLTGKPFRFVAIRGLRRSDYESPYGAATTFYFA
jgi:hypothetical protein